MAKATTAGTAFQRRARTQAERRAETRAALLDATVECLVDERPFDGPTLGHEPGMPIHHDLHAWVWKHNPAGTFAQFNPRVSCP